VTQDLRSLIIVRADRPDLYESLRGRLGPAHEVILDRRRDQRRRARQPVAVERRRGDRRQALTASEREVWLTSGYFVVFQPVALAETAERGLVGCATR
jgi:hypothetical protein